jgi:hypothetical protein
MNEKTTKEYLLERIWEKFCEWMVGQTVGVTENNEIDYYDHDVKRFADAILEGKKTYWD